MILQARDGIKGTWLDESGKPVRHVRWGDEEAGECETLAANVDGRPLLTGDGRAIPIRKKLKLKFVPKDLTEKLKYEALKAEANAPRRGSLPASVPAVLPSKVRRGTPLGPFTLEECEEKGCHRQAAWQTADEEEVEPLARRSGRLYQRAALKRRHVYCDMHYRFPTFVTLRGVENEVETTARPQ
jgi:hypothetical protein